MKKSNLTTMLASKAVFNFKKATANGQMKSTQHPTTGTTTNSTFIFSCFK